MFRNLDQAGQELAARVQQAAGGTALADAIVLGLPPGGVVVGAAVAQSLGAELDALVVHRITAPGRPGVVIGAMAEQDPARLDRRALHLLGLTEQQLAPEVARGRAELRRQEARYRQGRPLAAVTGRPVILVDDGLTVGITAYAALRHLRRAHPARLVLATPVCARDAAAVVLPVLDELVCLHEPWHLGKVADWYQDFHQLSQHEVRQALDPATTTVG
ncbi:phosphoribosyltransferase [Streptomyces tateyamensis]